MNTKTLSIYACTLVFLMGCAKTINYSPDHIAQTSGRYLFNHNEVIEVHYEANDLLVTWKEGTKKPVVLDENTFFVADLYQKLRFVVQPETQRRYLGIVSDDGSKIDYAYPKVADDFRTPWMHLSSGEYTLAAQGYLELKKQDSTKTYIEEQTVNRMGYDLLREKKHESAITVFKMNVALYPESDNVYDSLADAYLRSGDSAQAYTNYKKALELNTVNRRAKDYVSAYERSQK